MKERPPRAYITRAELLAAALKDPDFRKRYADMETPFPALVSYMRSSAGLTQEQVAQRAGLGRPLVSMLEAGTYRNTTWRTITAIAKACGYRLQVTPVIDTQEVEQEADRG